MAYNPYGQQQPQMYGQYNSLAPYQQRLDNMQQQQWGTQPQQQAQQQQALSINGRAVTGVEEAVASQIPLDGSVSVFTDFSHGKIYTKQLNFQDGSAIFKTYALAEQPLQAQQEGAMSAIEYAPMSEITALKTKIAELEAIISEKPKTKGVAEK